MKQRIQEQTEPKKLGGSVYITLSPVVRRIAGIEIGQAVTVIAEAGKIVIVKEEITEECKEECNETEKLYGVYGEDNEGVPCYNPNKIFSDIKMAKEYAILQKGKIAWGIAPVYEIFPKTVYEKVKKIDVRE